MLVVAALLAAAPARALTIVAAYDTSITNHPQAATIEGTINTALSQYQTTIQDPVTVNITFIRAYAGLGASSTAWTKSSYTNYLNALRLHASSQDDVVALEHLPSGPHNPIDGNDSLYLKTAQARALGLPTNIQAPAGVEPAPAISVIGAPPSGPGLGYDPEALRRYVTQRMALQPANTLVFTDGTIFLNLGLCNFTSPPTDAQKYSLYSVACHEIDEVLASGSALNGTANGSTPPLQAVYTQDLFRYDANGVRSYNTDSTAIAYFSLDGTTRLAQYNQLARGDYSDWYSPGAGAAVPQVQDAFQTRDSDPRPALEFRMLDVLGWNVQPLAVWVDYTAGASGQNGTYFLPYTTLTLGQANAVTGGLVVMKGNSHLAETPTITRAMTITTFNGPVTIGQ